MRIIPVIDLQRGQVVRGVAGNRQQYRPLQTQLTSDASPRGIAQAYADLGLSTAYLADLDAIDGAPPNLRLYRDIASAGLELWIDAGLQYAEQASQIAKLSISATTSGSASPAVSAIVGLERLSGMDALKAMLSVVGGQLIFSLDLKHGVPIVLPGCCTGQTARQIASAALEIGVQRMILLDLSRVGVGDGTGTEALCRWLRQQADLQSCSLEMIVGGGVRGVEDLHALADCGADAVLVASALHDGRLTQADIRPWLA